MEGWIKVHRKIIDNPIFTDPDLLRLWIYCLAKASFKETTVIIEKQEVNLLPGQFITGRFALNKEFNIGLAPRKKIKDTTLWSWLKRLETYGNIDIKSYSKYSVVTVVKWCEYQETLTTEPQQTDNKLTTEPQQTDTNKNVKNVKNDKNVKEIIYSSDFESFWNNYPRKIGKIDCYKVWNAIVKANEDPTIIIECAANYKNECIRLKTDKQYIKHPKTFLNSERYKDYLNSNYSEGPDTYNNDRLGFMNEI